MHFNIFAALLFAVVSSASGQFYEDITSSHLPSEDVHACMDVASGDLDADGDIDIVLAIEFEKNMVLINDGNGRFSSLRVAGPARDSEDIALHDFDEDGDLDLIFVSEDDQINEYYLNDGNGKFTPHQIGLPVHGTSNAVAVLDVNEDGAPDLLIGNFGVDRMLINDGTGNFRDESDARWQSISDTQDIELIDIEADGDLDVALANERQNQLFLNENGRLIDVTRQRLPQHIDESREMKAADFDGDGDMDLYVSNVRLHMKNPRTDVLLLNNGTGVFSIAPKSLLEPQNRDHYTVQTLDVDGDGDIDVILPSSLGLPQGMDFQVLLNDGNGKLETIPTSVVLPESVNGDGLGFDIEIADFNGDQYDDIFLCTRGLPAYMYDGSVTDGKLRLLFRKPGN